MKRNNYTISDSSKVFIYVLIAMIVLQLLFFPLLVNDDFLATVLTLFLPQLGFFLVYVYYNFKQKINYKKASRLKFNLNFKQIGLIILIGLVALYSFSPIVNMITYWLEVAGYSSGSSLTINSLPQLFTMILFIGIIPPICEELIFRGVIFNGMRKGGVWFGVFISALMFALMHMSLEQSIYQLFLGIVLALIVMITDSLFSSMILHAFNNIIVLLSTYFLSGSSTTPAFTTVWSNIEPFLFMLIGICLIVGLLFLLKNYTSKIKKAKEILSVVVNNNELTNISIQQEAVAEKSIKKTDEFWLTIALITGILLWIFSVIMGFFN